MAKERVTEELCLAHAPTACEAKGLEFEDVLLLYNFSRIQRYLIFMHFLHVWFFLHNALILQVM